MKTLLISKKPVVWITAAGFLLFTLLFHFKSLGWFDFWYWMSANLLVLMSLVFLSDPGYLAGLISDIQTETLQKFFRGLVSALLLYGLFYAGNKLLRWIFPFAAGGVEGVYAFRQDAPHWRIVLLMALIIGPGEELYWRGYLQRHFSDIYGKLSGFLLTTLLYTLVHVLTGNPVLVLAALICGLFWGWMYIRYRSVWINIVSHTLWDIGVFVLFPLS